MQPHANMSYLIPSLYLNMYPITNYCLITILPIILIVLKIPCSCCRRYENCCQPFHCGGIKNISYPFWGGNRSVNCGYPGFELFNCEGEMALIGIGSRTYRILEINYARQAFKVARQVSGNKIPQVLLHKTTLNSKLFRFPSHLSNSTETENLVMTGDQMYMQGTNITCNSSFPIPIDRNKTQVLASTSSSTKIVLHYVVAKSFTVKWLSNNTNRKKCTQTYQECGNDPHAAFIKCYMQKRRWLVKRWGAPFPSPSNRQDQRWLKEMSGLPFAGQSYKMSRRRLIMKRGGSSPRHNQGKRWPVEMGVPSTSPHLMLKKYLGEPFPSPPYTENQRWLVESGVVPSASPSSDQHWQSEPPSKANSHPRQTDLTPSSSQSGDVQTPIPSSSQPGQSGNQIPPTSSQSGDGPSPIPPSSQPGQSGDQIPPTSSQSGDGPSPIPPSIQPGQSGYQIPPTSSQSGDGPYPIPSNSQPGQSGYQIPPTPSSTQSSDGKSPIPHFPRGFVPADGPDPDLDPAVNGSRNGLSSGAKSAIYIGIPVAGGSLAVITLSYILICKAGCSLTGISINIILPIKIFFKKLPSKTGLKKNKPSWGTW
ncbi:uncharacterized protein [Henckelia pumila]|uniref:uncharacterized protein n=1 Tax=Henckelia pumila TaxID=405737 RepID=UPI003C6E67DB